MISSKTTLKALAATASLALAASASAATVTGSNKGLEWTAKSNIVGATSTGTVFAGGDPRYFATAPKYSGVASLIMEYSDGGRYICTGSLLLDTRSILTAAHCVAPQANATLVKTTAYFNNSGNPDTVPSSDPASQARVIERVTINPNYTGEVIDENDIAVLRMADIAPSFAQAYTLSSLTDLQGQTYNIAGYGGRSTVGGSVGVNAGTGRLRQGNNMYDYNLGNAAFEGFFDGFFGNASTKNVWIADFDTGLAVNSQSCRIAAAVAAEGTDLTPFCNRGVTNEVSSAGGDSGGPQFVDGKLASVTSFGLSFGTGWGDTVRGLQSSFGEMNGFVPVYAHLGFITGAIPEPSSFALFGIAGLGLLAARRRRA